jgi:hypothetical protein
VVATYWKVLIGDELNDEVVADLLARGIERLPDELDGAGMPMRALRVLASSRDESVGQICDVLHEHGWTYGSFATSRLERPDVE